MDEAAETHEREENEAGDLECTQAHVQRRGVTQADDCDGKEDGCHDEEMAEAHAKSHLRLLQRRHEVHSETTETCCVHGVVWWLLVERIIKIQHLPMLKIAEASTRVE